MQSLYKIKDMLHKELDEYSDKELTTATLEVIDKLTHALKSVETIIAMNESGWDRSPARNSGARGKYRNDRRDGMERYPGHASYNNGYYNGPYYGGYGFSYDDGMMDDRM